MRFKFEVNITCSKPVYLYFNENITLSDLHEQISIDIECNTMLMHCDIMSVPDTDETLKEYLERYPEYFTEWSGLLHKNIHKIYVMDKNT